MKIESIIQGMLTHGIKRINLTVDEEGASIAEIVWHQQPKVGAKDTLTVKGDIV